MYQKIVGINQNRSTENITIKSTNHVASSHRVTHSDQNRFHIDPTLTKIGEKFTNGW